MKTFDEIRSAIDSDRQILESRFKVKTIGIFGSCVRGGQKRRSDIDILVEFRGSVGFIEFIRLENHLKGLLGARVDLVTKSALKPHIGRRILSEVVYV